MFSIKASLILLVLAVFFVRISQVAKNNLCIFFVMLQCKKFLLALARNTWFSY